MDSGPLSLRCDCTPVADTRFTDNGSLSPVEAVIEAVASAAETDTTDLPPLFESIDLEAIEWLFTNAQVDGESGAVLGFTVLDWNVFVRDDGRVRVCDTAGPAEPSAIFD